jgi:cell division protein FtsL
MFSIFTKKQKMLILLYVYMHAYFIMHYISNDLRAYNVQERSRRVIYFF